MKFRTSFKCPDALYESINEAVTREVAALGLPEDEAEQLVETRSEKVQSACGHWFKYGEYVDLEVDTDADTVTVLRAR